MRRAKRRGLRSQQLLTRQIRVARVKSGRLRPARRLRAKQRPRRLARPRTPPFHGDNTGSNPVGDANKTKDLIIPSNMPKRDDLERFKILISASSTNRIQREDFELAAAVR